MPPKQSVEAIDFLMSCIEHGEIKIDFAAVNSKYDWTNRQASQLKYKSILAAHGLEVTGNERYTKSTAAESSSSPSKKAPLKRKVAEKPAGPRKNAKKAKTEDKSEEIVDNGEADNSKMTDKGKGKEKEKGKGRARMTQKVIKAEDKDEDENEDEDKLEK